jgi:hypothetical protein
LNQTPRCAKVLTVVQSCAIPSVPEGHERSVWTGAIGTVSGRSICHARAVESRSRRGTTWLRAVLCARSAVADIGGTVLATIDDVHKLLKAVNEVTLKRMEDKTDAINQVTLKRMEDLINAINQVTLKRMEDLINAINQVTLKRIEDLINAVNQVTLKRIEDKIDAVNQVTLKRMEDRLINIESKLP